MEAVADIFDRDGDGFIDYKEFVSALRPERDLVKPGQEPEHIHDEVKRLASKCTCHKQFRIHKIGEGKYRFGESQKLRLVRILRSTVMVRVGGGWVALDEFLVKNDPCRDRPFTYVYTRGRTNIELREQYILATGVSQSMAPFMARSPSSSASGGSQASGTASWSTGRTASSASGPITKIREKTQYGSPWRQQRSRVSPDTEVRQILSPPSGSRAVRRLLSPSIARPRSLTSPVGRPRSLTSPSSVGRPRGLASPNPIAGSRTSTSRPSSRPVSRPGSRQGSRPSSRQGSRPPSRAESEEADAEVFTTMQTDTRVLGGRPTTTTTYQTHVIQTRTVTMPTASAARTVTSKIPKFSPSGKKSSDTSSRKSDRSDKSGSSTPKLWR